MAERDRALIEALQTTLGVGSIQVRPPRDPKHLAQVLITVSGRRSHHRATIPFMERFLLPCAKRRQATTTVRPDTDACSGFLGGFVAAEGCFTGDGPRRFRFSVGLGATDAGMCHALRNHLGVGSITRSSRRQPHYDDEVQFAVQSIRELIEVVVPFMDAHLPPSHKREQYLAWRARLVDHWEHGARRRAPCTIDDCDAPAKAHGLCRPHLWQHRRQ